MLFGDLWVLKVSFMTHWHGILYTLSVICNDHLLMVLVCVIQPYENDWLATFPVPREAARESLVWQITKGKSLFSLFSSSSTFSPDKNKIYVAETDKVRTSSNHTGHILYIKLGISIQSVSHFCCIFQRAIFLYCIFFKNDILACHLSRVCLSGNLIMEM